MFMLHGHQVIKMKSIKRFCLLLLILFSFVEAPAQFGQISFYKNRKKPLTFTTLAQTVPAGVCSGVMIVSAPQVVLTPTVIDLTGNGTVQFFSDYNCLNPIVSVTIGTGLQTARFYFLESSAGSRTITGSHADYSNANQSQTIMTNAFVWTGGGGDSAWSTGGNWSGGVAPGPTHVALFNGTCISNCSPQITSATEVGGIRIEADYSGTITQQAGQTLLIQSKGFVMKGGSFVGGNSSIEIRSIGGFQQRGGTFTSTSSTLAVTPLVDGDLNLFYVDPVLATFHHNNGTVYLEAYGTPCPGNLYTVTVPANLDFWNLNLNTKISGCGSKQFWSFGGATFNILNNFTDERRYAELNDVTINLFGNLLLPGLSLSGGNGLIRFVGTANQTYAGGGSNADYGTANIEIFKPMAGTVTPANTQTVGFQTLNLSAGSFTAPSSTLHLGKGLAANQTVLNVATGTSWNHNNGEVSVNGTIATCSLYTYTLDVPDGFTFYTFKTNRVGGSGCGASQNINLIAGRKVTILGNFEYNFGRLNGTYEFYGNLTINGGASSAAATANLKALGTSEQLLSVLSGGFPTGGLTIDKGGTNRVLLMTAVNQATHSWNLQSGKIYMGGFNLTLQNLSLNGNTIHKRVVDGSGASGLLTVGGAPIANGAFLGGTVSD